MGLINYIKNLFKKDDDLWVEPENKDTSNKEKILIGKDKQYKLYVNTYTGELVVEGDGKSYKVLYGAKPMYKFPESVDCKVTIDHDTHEIVINGRKQEIYSHDYWLPQK